MLDAFSYGYKKLFLTRKLSLGESQEINRVDDSSFKLRDAYPLDKNTG